MIRFNVGPSPTVASFTTKPSGFRFALFSALAIALFSVLPIEKRRLFRSERKQIERRRNRQTLDLTRDFAHLERRNPRISYMSI